MTRLPFFLLCVSSVALADSWSGALVDGGCYANEEQNVTNKSDADVNHDRNAEIDRCTPNADTTNFTVVDHNGQSWKLDATGNVKAAKLVSERHVKGRLNVTVTGRKSGEIVLADSIAANQ
jgi:hypothetical protein